MIRPVTPDTHPQRIAQAANAMRQELRQVHQAVREENDPNAALGRIETLAEAMVVLTSMVEALAIQASRAR
jgi:hypothetical protein